jgi:hypothetical protein
MIQSHRNDLEPWYVRKKKFQNPNVLSNSFKKASNDEVGKVGHTKQSVLLIIYIFLVMIFAIMSGVFFTLPFFENISGIRLFVLISIGLVSLILSVFFIFYKIGSICFYLAPKNEGNNYFSLGIKYLNGQIELEELRKGVPAPEMALYQFIQQVRAYAMEKTFLKQKQDRPHDAFSNINGADPYSLLKRRWNDVLDSLNEFEIYLANDPKGIIEKLIVKSPPQNMDVSQIFRDVAETFDTTWRRKGINIEHAIVTPLKANTNEAVLRRLLVGPWRSCVYFARRGNGVVFSAKSIDGKIIARWECEGMAFPEEFFELVRNIQLDVNDRIEKGMALIALDPNSPNTLFALISFVTWVDLANVAGCDYDIKQGSEGLVVELRL